MLYTLLGRVVWRILRGYLRHKLPNAKRNAAIAGAVTLVAAVGAVVARRRTDDFQRPPRS